MQHADAALAGHGDRHPGLGDRVHRAGQQRDGAARSLRVSRVAVFTRLGPRPTRRAAAARRRRSGRAAEPCGGPRAVGSATATADALIGATMLGRADSASDRSAHGATRGPRRATVSEGHPAGAADAGRCPCSQSGGPGAGPRRRVRARERPSGDYGGGVHDEPIDPFNGDPADPSRAWTTGRGRAARPADRGRAAGRAGGPRRPGGLPGAAGADRGPRAGHRVRGLPRTALLRLGPAPRQPAPPARLGPAPGARAGLRPRPGPLRDLGVRPRLRRRRARHPERGRRGEDD